MGDRKPVERALASRQARRGAARERDVREDAARYPNGSVGAAFRAFRQSDAWVSKKPRTREDYWRAWKHIKPIFGDLDPNGITFHEFDWFYADLKKKISAREVHRTVKCWRVLWTVFGTMKLVTHKDPSLARANTAPQPRKDLWSEGEVVRLVKTAWRQGYYGLAALIAVGYDTAFSPVDARKLVANEMMTDGNRIWFELQRAKTGRDAVGTLTLRSERLLRAYLKWLNVELCGVELHAEAPIFRTRGGKPVSRPGRPGEHGGDHGGGCHWVPRPYSEDKLATDFRAVRAHIFGPQENRKLLDLRRTAAVEAIAGDADRMQVSAKLANSISATNSIHKTYAPVDLAQVQAADRARTVGRRRRRENKMGRKV